MACVLCGVAFHRAPLQGRVGAPGFIVYCLFPRKRPDGNLQSEATNAGKTKRDVDFESPDEPIFGKKPRVEESITEDLRWYFHPHT